MTLSLFDILLIPLLLLILLHPRISPAFLCRPRVEADAGSSARLTLTSCTRMGMALPASLAEPENGRRRG
eukprot:6374867-Pyramimonas_sp.AAC.1